jgi:hypothetical protein
MATELGGLVFEITRVLIGDLFRAKTRALQSPVNLSSVDRCGLLG